LRFIPSGAGVLTFNAASSTGFGDKQQTMWIRVSYWRNPEKLQPFLLKGGQVFVSGELTQREYDKDGQTRTSLELNATVIDLVGGKKESSQAQPAAQRPQQKRDNFDEEAPENGVTYEEYSSDIPF
jgi:single-strand DNA-binding protein